MSLDFPSNPADGQVYGNFYYSLSKGAWRATTAFNSPSAWKNAVGTTATSSSVPLTVQGVSGQSANLQEWKSSSGSTVASISPVGALNLNTSLTVQNGGTGANNQADARASLGVQPSADPSFTGTVSAVTISATQRVIGTTPNDSGSTGGLAVKAPAGGSQTSAYLQFVNNGYSAQYGAISANPSSVISISASQVRMPSQPSFHAYRPAGNNWSQSSGVLPLFSTRHNIGGNYNTSNYRFTAPVAGTYMFTVHANVYSAGGVICQMGIRINGSLNMAGNRFNTAGGDQDGLFAASVSLNAGDYVEPYSFVGSSMSYSSGEYWNHFTGYLLG